MKVMATQVGFDGLCLRHPGDEFEIPDKLNEAGNVIAFSRKWMRKIETEDEKETPPQVA